MDSADFRERHQALIAQMVIDGDVDPVRQAWREYGDIRRGCLMIGRANGADSELLLSDCKDYWHEDHLTNTWYIRTHHFTKTSYM